MHENHLGFLAVHVATLQSGLRFPIPRPVVKILHALGLSPTQLAPNSYSILLSFAVLMRCLGFPASFENFWDLFNCQSSAKSESSDNTGFYYITARPGRKIILPITTSFGKFWKERWFYIRPHQGIEFPVLRRWATGKVNPGKVGRPSWGNNQLEHLLNLYPLDARLLCTERALVRAGLSPAEVEGADGTVLGSPSTLIV